MNNQKNRFFTFLLSLFPGCGEMYFGLYRQGISLLITFLLLLLLPVAIGLAVLSLLSVVVWFYSFLHTHNLRSLSPEEFAKEEDGYIWDNASDLICSGKNGLVALAVVLIVLGLWLVWNNTFGLLSWFSNGFIAYFLRRLPQVAIGVGIIWLGWRLIVSKKQELEDEIGSEPPEVEEAQPKDAEPVQEESTEEAPSETEENDHDQA